jgi:hypothetical protein
MGNIKLLAFKSSIPYQCKNAGSSYKQQTNYVLYCIVLYLFSIHNIPKRDTKIVIIQIYKQQNSSIYNN